MTTTDSPAIALEPLDLAAMLCSRVCHDVISPVGAIVNGLEVLEDESEPSMRDVALDLIKRSAGGASAKLQFCRLAFGAAGSVGASIDTGDAETVARGLLETEKTALAWKAPRQFLPKNKVKLLLNLSQIAALDDPARRRHRGRGDRRGRGGEPARRLQGSQRAACRRVSPISCAGIDGVAKVDAHTSSPISRGLSRANAA